MPNIIYRKPGFAERFGEAVGSGVGAGIEERMGKAAEEKKLDQLTQELVAGGKLSPEQAKMLARFPEARKSYFEQMFPAPEKPMTPLQQAQMQDYMSKIQQRERQGKLFEGFFGSEGEGAPQQDFTSQILGKGPEQAATQGALATTEQPQAPGQKVDMRNPQTWPEDLLKKAAGFAGQPTQEGVFGNIAKAELDRREQAKKETKELRKEERTIFEGERTYQTSFSRKAEEEADTLRTTIPKKEMALGFARDAIESGNLEYFSPDKLADATGIDLFRTAKGAQLVTAGKENLLGNLSRVSAKAQNQWMEQRMNSMFPKIGQSKEANLTTQEMLDGEIEMDKAYLKEFDRLAAEDEERYGYVKKDIKKRAQNAAEPRQKEILKKSTFKMKEIEEQEKGLTSLKNQVGKNVPRGTPLTLAMAKLYKEKFGDNALKVAEKNGYWVPTIEEYMMFRE